MVVAEKDFFFFCLLEYDVFAKRPITYGGAGYSFKQICKLTTRRKEMREFI
jgi:hypothetical protein